MSGAPREGRRAAGPNKWGGEEGHGDEVCAPSPTLEAVLIDGDPLGAQTPERLRKPRDGRQNNTTVCGSGDAIIGPDLSHGETVFSEPVTETPPKRGLRQAAEQ